MDFIGVLIDIYPKLLSGLWMTLQVSFIAIFIAFFLGLCVCLMNISSIKPLNWIARFYIWIIRGTPFIVQLFIIKYGIPQVLTIILGRDTNFSIYQAAIATLALNAGAYMSEIFRGGIQAVSVGQMEAARSLGLPKSRAMIKIVLPQALKISLPSLCNQFIISIKDSSLAQVIGLGELFYEGKKYVGSTFKSFETYILVGCVYLLIITVLTYFIKIIERKSQYVKKSKGD